MYTGAENWCHRVLQAQRTRALHSGGTTRFPDTSSAMNWKATKTSRHRRPAASCSPHPFTRINSRYGWARNDLCSRRALNPNEQTNKQPVWLNARLPDMVIDLLLFNPFSHLSCAFDQHNRQLHLRRFSLHRTFNNVCILLQC